MTYTWRTSARVYTGPTRPAVIRCRIDGHTIYDTYAAHSEMTYAQWRARGGVPLRHGRLVRHGGVPAAAKLVDELPAQNWGGGNRRNEEEE